MDDTPCQRFFLEPDQPLHRRYAALRAVFIDGLSLQAAAEQFGSTYHTVRSWVRDFRAACRAGQVPPFSPSRAWWRWYQDAPTAGLNGVAFLTCG